MFGQEACLNLGVYKLYLSHSNSTIIEDCSTSFTTRILLLLVLNIHTYLFVKNKKQ